MADSDEAAKIITVTGWVSSTGRFFGDDERLARYDGSTHTKCECGSVIERCRIMCNDCFDKKQAKKYNELKTEAWDGKTPLYSNSTDRYFWNEEDLFDFCEEADANVDSLDLVICEPVYPHELCASEIYADDLPEDTACDPELEEAFEELNKKIREQIEKKKVLSWQPSKIAAIIE